MSKLQVQVVVVVSGRSIQRSRDLFLVALLDNYRCKEC